MYLAKLQARLLQTTLDYATRCIPAYQKHRGSFSAGAGALGDWDILYKKNVTDNPAAYQNPGLDIALRKHTTGTTGNPFFVPLSSTEIAFKKDFNALLTRQLVQSQLPADSYAICLSSDVNGDILGYDFERHFSIYVTIDDAHLLAGNFVQLYEQQKHAEGILIGSPELVRYLTEQLMGTGSGPLPFKPKAVLVNGFLSTDQFRFLQQCWHTDIIMRYGLTEISGYAYSTDNEIYTLNETVYPEFLDIQSLQPKTAGVAAFVATDFYPFAQKQLLVRYWTDDVVRVLPSPEGVYQFSIIGRLKSCIYDRPRNQVVLGWIELYNFLYGFSDIHKSYKYFKSLTTKPLFGDLRFRMAQDLERISLQVEITEYEAVNKEQRALEMREAIFGQFPVFRDFIAREGIEFRILIAPPLSLRLYMQDEFA